MARRARIVLAAAAGLENKAICVEVGADANTVSKWRRRFAAGRLDGLLDEPRPGTPRKIGDDEIAETIRLTLEARPSDATHWSLRSMAKAVGHAPSTIHRIWRAFGLQPHRTETFKLSNDPLFVDKVREIVGLDLSPPDRALVLCVDEKSQIQALDRTQPLLPMRPAVARPDQRREHLDVNCVPVGVHLGEHSVVAGRVLIDVAVRTARIGAAESRDFGDRRNRRSAVGRCKRILGSDRNVG
jgi:transposase